MRNTSQYGENPMLLNPTSPVHDQQTNTEAVLQRIQFPIRYNFPQNQQTGVVDRRFTGHTSPNKYFYLMSTSNQKVLEASPDDLQVSVQGQKQSSSDANCQLWMLDGKEGHLKNKCTNKFLANEGDSGCR